MGYKHVLWVKAVPLKVNIFVWHLFLNRIPTKDNLVRLHILANNDARCSFDCGYLEDRDHFFFQSNLYGRLRNLIYGWLGFSKVHHGNILDHLLQFNGLGGFSKNYRLTFNIIWILV